MSALSTMNTIRPIAIKLDQELTWGIGKRYVCSVLENIDF